MNLRVLFFRRIAFVSLFFYFSILSSGMQDYSLPEAQKVLKAIEKIESGKSAGEKGPLREIVITESELNSYIAYRIETEKEQVMKELRLKLFKKNKIEGKVLIDLKGQKIPKLLRPQMTLYFGAKIEVKDGNIRFDFKDLFLEEQRIQPTVVDLIIYIGSKIDKTEPWGLKDWFVLPYGMKDIKVQRRKAIFYY